jgi:hypothetical protein
LKLLAEPTDMIFQHLVGYDFFGFSLVRTVFMTVVRSYLTSGEIDQRAETDHRAVYATKVLESAVTDELLSLATMIRFSSLFALETSTSFYCDEGYVHTPWVERLLRSRFKTKEEMGLCNDCGSWLYTRKRSTQLRTQCIG